MIYMLIVNSFIREDMLYVLCYTIYITYLTLILGD